MEETEMKNISNLTLNYFPVESSDVSLVVAFFTLIIGVFGNLLGILAFHCRPLGKRPMVVDRMIGILCFIGLTTTIVCAPLHLYAYLTEVFPKDSSLCQVQGLLLNLLCLISLWYTAVLAIERFFRIASPHEHRLTFSPLNLNVILAGVFVLLLVEVSGPIYGWAEYGYLNDTSVCLLNPEAKHIFTYSLIHVTCYVALPVLATIGSTCYIIQKGIQGNARLCYGSQVFRTPKSMVIIGLAMLLSMLLFLPYHITLLLQALFVPITAPQKIASYWLHIIAITCIYPIIIFTVGAKEVIPVLLFLMKELKECQLVPDSTLAPMSSQNNPVEVRKTSSLHHKSGSFKELSEDPRSRSDVKETSFIVTTEFPPIKSDVSDSIT